MGIPAGWELPEAIRGRLGESSGKQRAMLAEGHLLLILHRVPEVGTAQREGAYFWRLPNGEWRASDGKAGLGALKNHLDSYASAVTNLEAQSDAAANAAAYFAVLEAAVPLHRATSNQQAALQAARDGMPDARDVITLRDRAADIERAAELLHADAQHALDYHIARQAEEQSRLALDLSSSAYKLNLLAALFLPITAVAAVFGMNLTSGFEGREPGVFWAVVGGAAVK